MANQDNLKFFEDANAFLEHTLPVFKADVTRHRLMLGIAIALQKRPDAFGEKTPLMTLRLEDTNEHASPTRAGLLTERVQADFIAIMTPPYPILVWFKETLSDVDLLKIALAIKEKGWDLPGVNGIATCSSRFASIWVELNQINAPSVMHSMSYELTRVIFPESIPAGCFQFAQENQAEILLKYMNDMQVDLNASVRIEYTLEHIHNFIAGKRIGIWLVDDQPASMAMSNRPQLSSIGISAVYTPNEYRGKGYASAVVASLSQELLNQGYQRINLFTDLANPTSNKIYKAIGFKEVCDYQEFKFTFADKSFL